MPRMSKNGTDFFDVDDTDESLAAAKTKGYIEYLPMTKNGTDVFDVEASEDSYKAAIGKGYKDVAQYQFENTKSQNVSQGAAALKGAAQGFSAELADEAYGVVGAVVNPTDSDKGLVERYRDSRDYARGGDDAAQAQHPGTYTGANVAGAVGTGLLTAGVGNTLKGSAAFGAVSGLGGSKADLTDPSLENYGQAALDTATGGALGAAGYGAGKLIEKVGPSALKVAEGAAVGTVKGVRAVGDAVVHPIETVSKVPGALKDLYEYGKGLGRGAARGAVEAGENMPTGVKQVAEVVGSVKGLVGEIKAQGATTKEFTEKAAEAREFVTSQVKAGMKIRPLQDLKVVGNGKQLVDYTDDEVIVAALLSEGDNATKKWVAQKSATLYPGQVDADEYGKILGLSSDVRTAAREFDPREAAKSLKPVVEETQDMFQSLRNSRFNELQQAAKKTFDSDGATSVLDELDGAIADANRLNSIPAKTSGLLADVHGMMNDGKGVKSQKLTEGVWLDVDPAERFHRLQKSRELLDGEIKWTSREGHSQAEIILRHMRDRIDDALKTSPEKVEGDALYRASKELEAKFFGATEFRNSAGGIDVDEGKIARLLGNTDTANRFKGAIEDMRAFAQRDDLGPEFRAQADDLIAKLEGHVGSADTKRQLGAFRYKNGPSSPAIERLNSASRGNTLLQDAVQSPAGFVHQAEGFNKLLKSRLGRGFDGLNDDEKKAAVKFYAWAKSKPDAGPEATDKMWAKFFTP